MPVRAEWWQMSVESPPGHDRDGAPDGTWVLQPEAAAVAGCSVSVIRKWRRAGHVGQRTRVTPGGMRRVEVRLEDVLARARDSIPRSRSAPPAPPHSPAPEPASPARAVAVVPVNDLDVFVERITDAERRAAHLEARLQATEALTQFLRDRVTDLEAQLRASQAAQDADTSASRQSVHLHRVAVELRALRARIQRVRESDPRQSERQLVAATAAYDAALVAASLASGLPTRVRLGDTLTVADRAKLAQALEDIGLDIRL